MIGIILAAGKGTRLRPLTGDKPKAMVQVAGKPMIEYGFDQLESLGVDEIDVVVGYKKQRIIEYYGRSYQSIPIRYVVQDEQLGTAHALRQVDCDDEFALVFCDSLFQNTVEVGEYDDGVIFTQDVSYEKAKSHGVVDTEDGVVTNLVEKPDSPPTTQAIAGFYILPPDVIEYCYRIEPSDRDEYEITDALQAFINDGGVLSARKVDGWRYNVNDTETLETVEELLTTSTQ